jgi:cytochrome c oxidase subunit 1
LTENFAVTPIMDHEAYDYEWLDKQKAKEVASVG